MNSALQSPFSYVLDRTRNVEAIRPDEVVTLAAAARSGDPEASARIVTANAKLCVHIVNLIAPNGSLRDDLFSAALQGLTEAVKTFDPSKGCLVAYAGYFIRREIYETLSVLGYPVRTTPRQAKAMRLIKEARARIEARGLDPTVARLAKESRYQADTVLAVQFLETPPQSLDGDETSSASSKGSLLPCDNPSPANSVLHADDHVALHAAMADCLDETERSVVARYFGLNDIPAESLASIGRSMKLTRSRIGQIVDKAREKLRDAMGEDMSIAP